MKLTIAVRISLKCEIEITILENNLDKRMHVAQYATNTEKVSQMGSQK